MPSHHCQFPTCTAMLPSPGYCAAHQPVQRSVTAARHRHYDQHQRDPAAKKFYDSAEWKRCRADVLADHPVCQRCNRTFAQHVHHTKPLRECSPEERIDRRLLLAVCQPCHNAIESEVAPAGAADSTPITTLVIVEDEIYRYDAEKAEKPIRFIEKHCRHYEGKFAGQPFLLLDWEKELIRTLFGWVDRVTGLRRFKELYLLTGKGAGKTPLLAAIGLYMLLADGEAAPHVISMAATSEQAHLTFNAASRYIDQSDALKSHARTLQHNIATRKFGRWNTISGKPTGRSGYRPSCLISDEVHEWPASTTITYELMTANLFKRLQPLLLVATNAAESRGCFAWSLHQRALKVLLGEIKDDSLLPVIYEAPADLPWDSEEAARAANPSMGSIVQFSQLAAELAKAKESPAAESRYRRLYLSQWVTGTNKWLRMEMVDAAAGAVDPDQLKHLPLFIGVDLSQCDDLCAAVFLWTSPERYYVTSRFWVPATTASHYQTKEGIPYDKWIEDGDITALNDKTITPQAQADIAAEIIELTAGQTVKAVCYDRYKADRVIGLLEAAGLQCTPVVQGYGVSPGCQELERRFKDSSIVIQPNSVMAACCQNVEVKSGERGDIAPVKPNARGKYAGKRGAKIDGVVALVTAMTEAKRQDITTEEKPWTGEGLLDEGENEHVD
jgi:phage terminase large subunit-like protein